VPEPGCDQIQEAHHLLGMSRLRLEDPESARVAFDRCANINRLTETGKACTKALESL
jgi:hypothetical protein